MLEFIFLKTGHFKKKQNDRILSKNEDVQDIYNILLLMSLR
jgi:hypothetical protein